MASIIRNIMGQDVRIDLTGDELFDLTSEAIKEDERICQLAEAVYGDKVEANKVETEAAKEYKLTDDILDSYILETLEESGDADYLPSCIEEMIRDSVREALHNTIIKEAQPYKKKPYKVRFTFPVYYEAEVVVDAYDEEDARAEAEMLYHDSYDVLNDSDIELEDPDFGDMEITDVDED